MAYKNSNGDEQFTLKEKIDYHNSCANTGKTPSGEKLSFSERYNHMQASARCRRKLGTFMKTVNVVNSTNKKK